jgi:hypothetical protein
MNERNALGADDGDEDDEGGYNSDEDTLNLVLDQYIFEREAEEGVVCGVRTWRTITYRGIVWYDSRYSISDNGGLDVITAS